MLVQTKEVALLVQRASKVQKFIDILKSKHTHDHVLFLAWWAIYCIVQLLRFVFTYGLLLALSLSHARVKSERFMGIQAIALNADERPKRAQACCKAVRSSCSRLLRSGMFLGLFSSQLVLCFVF
jgi:hypothetical protein